ncbi:hypothetical protein SAMN05421823_10173 [Catalinimonas alkaloidigena]|uniref:Por secretion system C-terminal sorting domain-containing protein n=1 Tax=Catalinimonas alkaloidigena TaxID=1075417 RepID=A0A1G8WG74_9BACT|nr:hypothetical protein [Catalinimonas alkaloidigena]SDJ77173.1 hypothetical protein SAMN05421823_10173 [Catalinimonas alkaloidigena]
MNRTIALGALLLWLGTGTLLAKEVPGKNNPGDKPTSAPPPPATPLADEPCAPFASTSRAELDINRVRALVLNGGDMWWNLEDAPRYEVPKQDDPTQPKKHSLFAGAVWIGGREARTGNLLVSAQTYRQGNQTSYWPGPLNDQGITANDTCVVWNRHFKVSAATIDDFIADYTDDIEPEAIPDEIRYWPGRGNLFMLELFEKGADWANHMNRSLAPFVDVDGDGIYNPQNGDYPRIRGDQSIWWIMNDAGGTKDLGEGTGGAAIGMEVKVEAFAYSTNDYVDFMTFYEQTLINKGSRTVEETYMGQWVDPDLGNYDDDFVGCDVERGLGICYNGDELDEGIRGYGENPPSIGVDFFEGPRADPNDGIDNDRDCLIDEGEDGVDNDGDGEIDEEDEKELIIMSNFLYYNNDFNPINGNPENITHYFNYLRSIWKNGNRVTYDGKDGTTQNAALPSAAFMFPGESDLETGWGLGGTCQTPVNNPNVNYRWDENYIDRGAGKNVPADRRFLQSAGPFTLEPGATNRITIGVVWARANSGGATGSFNALLAADDLAQRLFDRNFEFLDGPNAPDLAITELDQELIITITPDTFSIVPGGPQVTTESYVEYDNATANIPGVEDPYYRFQGYRLYQLRDNTVSTSEVNDATKARLVLQADLRDDITTLINYEFDPTVGQEVPVLKVSGENNGLARTVRITQDLFASGESQLVNYKRYYYTIVAYAANGDPLNPTPYLEGRNNGQAYTAIPHKTEFTDGGLVLNAIYGTQVDITRLFGVGSGGQTLELVEGQEAQMLSPDNNYRVQELTYRAGNAPVVVKVYDPRRVTEAEFQLDLYSRLVYDKTATNYQPQVGDTLISTGNYTNPSLGGGSRVSQIPQTAGVAVVRRIRTTEETDRYRSLEVDVLNDEVGGTFVLTYDSILTRQSTNDPEVFIGYTRAPQPFIKKGNPAQSASCAAFDLHDYWELTNLTTGVVLPSQKRVSEFDEQLVPDYGISILVQNVRDPGYLVFENTGNGFRDARFRFSNDERPWLNLIPDGVADGGVDWLLSDDSPLLNSRDQVSYSYDPNLVYKSVLDGRVAPYLLVESVNEYDEEEGTSGGSYPLPSASTNVSALNKLNNVDIVITADKSLWSRVPVLQTDLRANSAPISAYRLNRSTLPSLNSDFAPSGEQSPYDPSRPSTGMSWFPGYAIDLDKGVRLNLMFAESREADPAQGDNLQWQPTTAADGGRNFVYITNTPYDQGRALERYLDSLEFTTLSKRATFGQEMSAFYQRNVTWVFNPRQNGQYDFLDSDARIQLRVDKAFRSYPTGDATQPRYFFTTQGIAAQRGQVEVAKTALDLVRAVPNPYYAYSDYETTQLDNRVRFTNLPQRCVLTIFTANGTLIRQLRKDDNTTFLDWDLRNRENLPIASGMYLIHVDAFELGERVIKWFGINRPADLDSF